VSPESKEKLATFFEVTEYVIVRVFVILSLVFALTVVLLVEFSRLSDLRHLLHP
jgi:hypothetical protein